jgi:hypothetical protein
MDVGSGSDNLMVAASPNERTKQRRPGTIAGELLAEKERRRTGICSLGKLGDRGGGVLPRLP